MNNKIKLYIKIIMEENQSNISNSNILKIISSNGNEKDAWENLICNINSEEINSNDIIMPLFENLKNKSNIEITLDITDFLVNYGTPNIIELISKKDYLGNILELLKNSSNSSIIVQKKIIFLTQKWAKKYENEKNLNVSGFNDTYNSLKKGGIIFPPLNYKLETYTKYFSDEEAQCAQIKANAIKKIKEDNKNNKKEDIDDENKFANPFSLEPEEEKVIEDKKVFNNKSSLNHMKVENKNEDEDDNPYKENDNIGEKNDINQNNNLENKQINEVNENDIKNNNNNNNEDNINNNIYPLGHPKNKNNIFENENEQDSSRYPNFPSQFDKLIMNDLNKKKANNNTNKNNQNNQNNNMNNNNQNIITRNRSKTTGNMNNINNNQNNRFSNNKYYNKNNNVNNNNNYNNNNYNQNNFNNNIQNNRNFNQNNINNNNRNNFNNNYNNNNINNNYYRSNTNFNNNNINNNYYRANTNFNNNNRFNNNFNNNNNFFNQNTTNTFDINLFKTTIGNRLLQLNSWIDDGRYSFNSGKLKEGIIEIINEIPKCENLMNRCKMNNDRTGYMVAINMRNDIEQTCSRYEDLMNNSRVEKFCSSFTGNTRRYYFNKNSMFLNKDNSIPMGNFNDYYKNCPSSGNYNNQYYQEKEVTIGDKLNSFGNTLKDGLFFVGGKIKDTAVSGYNYVKDKINEDDDLKDV